MSETDILVAYPNLQFRVGDVVEVVKNPPEGVDPIGIVVEVRSKNKGCLVQHPYMPSAFGWGFSELRHARTSNNRSRFERL